MTTLVADAVIPVEGAPLIPGHVRIANGAIVEVGAGRPSGDDVVDYGKAAILPGLVNAHTHLGCSFLKAVADDASFYEWITGGITPRVIDAVENRPEEIVAAAATAARQLAEGGVTTAVDSFFHDAGIAALEAAGLRGVFCPEVFGAMSHDLVAYADEARAIVRDAAEADGRAGRVARGVAPHSPYTCPRDILSVVAEEARAHDLLVTVHVSESPEEQRFFTEAAGPMFELFTAKGREGRYRTGVTPVAMLDELGLLGPRTLTVHAVQVTSDDIDLLAARGASVAHCPVSNMRLAVGIAPVVELRAAGVNVCLGTDSEASNGKLDMFEEMRSCILAQRARLRRASDITAADALEMATIAGARALGRADEIGSIVPGKRADLAVVRLDRPRHAPATDPVSAVVWSATPDDVTAVWVDGEPLVRTDAS